MFDSPNSPYNNFGHSEDELSALRDYLTTVDEYGNLKADNQQQENIFEVPKTDDIPITVTDIIQPAGAVN